MNRAEIRRIADRVRAIPLEAVLEALEAERDPDDPARWRTSRGALSVTGAKFMNWHRDVGGGGAIDLVIHLEGRPFLAAVAWLEQRFPDPAGTERPGAAPSPSPGRRLELPLSCPAKLVRVLRYLEVERGLPAALVHQEVEEGDLYADRRGNAVFLMHPDEGSPVGAEIRGTGPRPFRGLARGSRKDLGAFVVPTPGSRMVVLCESAIDALSCHVLHPDLTCLSTAGARADPPWLRNLRIDHRVYCGFDDDQTGNAMARAMIALHPDVKRLRPPLKDWNETLRPRR